MYLRYRISHLGVGWNRLQTLKQLENKNLLSQSLIIHFTNECSNYCTIALISHASKVILKILQARLQQYVNRELPDVQAGFTGSSVHGILQAKIL